MLVTKQDMCGLIWKLAQSMIPSVPDSTLNRDSGLVSLFFKMITLISNRFKKITTIELIVFEFVIQSANINGPTETPTVLQLHSRIFLWHHVFLKYWNELQCCITYVVQMLKKIENQIFSYVIYFLYFCKKLFLLISYA